MAVICWLFVFLNKLPSVTTSHQFMVKPLLMYIQTFSKADYTNATLGELPWVKVLTHQHLFCKKKKIIPLPSIPFFLPFLTSLSVSVSVSLSPSVSPLSHSSLCEMLNQTVYLINLPVWFLYIQNWLENIDDSADVCLEISPRVPWRLCNAKRVTNLISKLRMGQNKWLSDLNVFIFLFHIIPVNTT